VPPAFVLAMSIVVPASAVVPILLSRRRPNLRETWTVLASLALFALVVSLLPAVLRGQEPSFTLFDIADGLPLAFRADALGAVFATVASFLWVLTSIYAIGYVRGNGERDQTRFFASFAACLAAVMGLAFAANLLTFFVFYELLTVATYPLVTHKGTPEAIRAGRRYLAYLITGGAALLIALAVIYQAAGDVEFRPGGFVAGHLSPAAVTAVFVLFVIGFGSKSAIMPIHRWLPSAMVAPTPVSALLHAVAVVKAGVFGFARSLGHVIGPSELASIGVAVFLSSIAALTIVVASLIALTQDNLKRRLAYSTIAHLSYIVLGLSLLTPTGWTGGLYHLVNHAALKITLFFCAGALYVHVHLDRVSQLDGIGRRMPVTMGAFAVASAGLAGLPPMGGFMSKSYLVLGAADAERLAFAGVMLVSGVLTAGYLFPIATRAFLRPTPNPPGAASAPDEVGGATPTSAGRAGTLVAERSEVTEVTDVVEGTHHPGRTGGVRRLLEGEASPLMVVPLVITALVGLLLGIGDLFSLFELSTSDADAVFGGAR
jgi:multicomponent Na+:H+ antiporter subunit D